MQDNLPRQVSPIDPTKRGLKERITGRIGVVTVSFTHRPDEKGTERKCKCFQTREYRRVSPIDPTKRGLKGYFFCWNGPDSGSFTHRPDEKGTESQLKRLIL